MRTDYDQTLERLAGEWSRLAWWLPITWSEYKTISTAERYALFEALKDIQREQNGNDTFTGQGRMDKKLGLR